MVVRREMSFMKKKSLTKPKNKIKIKM